MIAKRHVPDQRPVTFDGVTFSFDAIEEGLRKCVSETIEVMLKDCPVSVHLPYHWTMHDIESGKKDPSDGSWGPGVTDPLELHVMVEALGDESQPPTYTVTLHDVLAYAMTTDEDGDLCPTSPPSVLIATAEALEREARWLREVATKEQV